MADTVTIDRGEAGDLGAELASKAKCDRCGRPGAYNEDAVAVPKERAQNAPLCGRCARELGAKAPLANSRLERKLRDGFRLIDGIDDSGWR